MLACFYCVRPSESSECARIAEAMPDHRDQSRVRHEMFELVTARSFAIACGYKLCRARHNCLCRPPNYAERIWKHRLCVPLLQRVEWILA